MVSLVLTAAFGVLGASSVYFARRDEEGSTFFWTMATLCALAFGFSLGSFNQDARLKNEIAALEARLQSDPGDLGPASLPEQGTSLGAERSFGGNAAPPLESSDPDPLEAANPPNLTRAEAAPLEAPPSAGGVTSPADETVAASGGGSISATGVTLADLAGQWEMTTTIERTAYPAFAGLELTFRLSVRAEGDTLYATGNKSAERVPGAARTLSYAPSAANRIVLTGTLLDEGTLALSFEEGADLASGGTMTLQVVSPERLEGVFLSSSADSSGSSRWRKVGGGG